MAAVSIEVVVIIFIMEEVANMGAALVGRMRFLNLRTTLEYEEGTMVARMVRNVYFINCMGHKGEEDGTNCFFRHLNQVSLQGSKFYHIVDSILCFLEGHFDFNFDSSSGRA